jgi:hypothetical protein
MKVVLGAFARFCVETRFGDVATGVQAAVRHYCRRPLELRPSIPVPSAFGGGALERLSGGGGVEAGPSSELEVRLEADLAASLMDEATSRSVGLQELLNHAVLVYMADLDRYPASFFAAAEEAPASGR